LARLDDLDVAALRVMWRARFKTKPPRTQSGQILRLEIAWRLQAAIEGDLDRITRRRLTELATGARASKPSVKAKTIWPIGTRLVRDWRGETHRVDVTADGFVHAGIVHRSLTAVARKISGVHRSGRKFFQTASQ
jgi:hypothetical protein